MPWVRAPQEAVRLKVTLKGLKPPVWRRLVAEDTITLGELHMAVQAAMGWENSHLHLFMVEGAQVGDPRQLDEVEDEARLTVGELAARGVRSFGYVYDMGDDWEHAIAIEGSGPLETRPGLSGLHRREGRLPAGGFGRAVGVRRPAGGGGGPGGRAPRGGERVARGVRSGGVLGRGGGGAGAGVVRAEAGEAGRGGRGEGRWREG